MGIGQSIFILFKTQQTTDQPTIWPLVKTATFSLQPRINRVSLLTAEKQKMNA